MSVSKLVTTEFLSLGWRIGMDTDWVCWTSASLMSMGGENTATSCFKSVEHVVEVTAKRRLFLVTSVTPISTLKKV